MSSACPRRTSGVLGDVDGLDVVELGCGTAYCLRVAREARSAPGRRRRHPGAARDGAAHAGPRPGIEFPLVEASAEDVPLPDAAFDLAVSEYGASIWCDPARWMPEAARLLRPGGRLVFLTNSTLAMLCVPDEPGACDRERSSVPSAACTALDLAGRGRCRVPPRTRRADRPAPRERASRSSASSSSTRPTMPRRTRSTTRRRRSGRASGRAEDLWVARKTG